jgi:hypothetical protein
MKGGHDASVKSLERSPPSLLGIFCLGRNSNSRQPNDKKMVQNHHFSLQVYYHSNGGRGFDFSEAPSYNSKFCARSGETLGLAQDSLFRSQLQFSAAE